MRLFPILALLSLCAALAHENEVTITIEGDYRLIQSNGWPDHEPGKFPNRRNPNAASPQSYNFRIPLNPKKADAASPSRGWWWGVALNGVPFEPGTAEAWNNDRRSGWSYEAATGFLDLGLDEHNAHVQPTGAYHYHATPSGLIKRGEEMQLVGWAADGYPVYVATGAKTVTSSYQLKKGTRPTEPKGPGGEFDGTFTEDFEYVSGSGDLDAFNGRTGPTPEFPEGTYHYYITPEFPFIPRVWRGEPDPSFSKRGGGPPGGKGGKGEKGKGPKGGPPSALGGPAPR